MKRPPALIWSRSRRASRIRAGLRAPRECLLRLFAEAATPDRRRGGLWSSRAQAREVLAWGADPAGPRSAASGRPRSRSRRLPSPRAGAARRGGRRGRVAAVPLRLYERRERRAHRGDERGNRTRAPRGLDRLFEPAGSTLSRRRSRGSRCRSTAEGGPQDLVGPRRSDRGSSARPARRASPPPSRRRGSQLARSRLPADARPVDVALGRHERADDVASRR